MLERTGNEGAVQIEAIGAQAALLRHLADPDGARAKFERAIEIGATAEGIDPFTMAATRANLAATHMDLGDLPAAHEMYTEATAAFTELLGGAREGFERARGDQHMTFVRTAIATVNALVGTERYDEAIRVGKEGLRIAENVVGADHPLTAFATAAIGRAQLAAGAPEVVIHLEAALRILEAHSTPLDALSNAQFELAQALWIDANQRDRARSMARSARRILEGMEGEASLRDDIDAWLDTHR